MYPDMDALEEFVGAWEISSQAGTLQRSLYFADKLVSRKWFLDKCVGPYSEGL